MIIDQYKKLRKTGKIQRETRYNAVALCYRMTNRE
jgi:hypothetical protein